MADVVLDFEYNHSIQKVWQGLTDSDLLSEWILPNDFKAEKGHKFQFTGEANEYWDGIIRGEVVEVDEPNKLVYQWASAGETTVITWKLTELAPDQTDLHFEMDGFSEETKQYPGALEGAASSWTEFADNLKNVLDKVE